MGLMAAMRPHLIQVAALGAAGAASWSWSEQGKVATCQEVVYKGLKGEGGGEHQPRFRVFSHNGQEVGSVAELASRLLSNSGTRAILCGEYHDDAIAHAIELELFSLLSSPTPTSSSASSSCHASPRRRCSLLSLEMLERDTQPVLEEWLAHQIRDQDLLKDARAWPNHTTDYAPLLLLARARGVPVIASNAPRRYVSMAGREGKEAVEELVAKGGANLGSWLAPVPWMNASRQYVERINTEMGAAAREMARIRKDRGMDGDGERGAGAQNEESGACPYIGFNVSTNFLAAQSLWDSTMAFSIAKALEDSDTVSVLILEPVVESELRIESPSDFRGKKWAQGLKEGDYVILTNAELPRSFQVEHPV